MEAVAVKPTNLIVNYEALRDFCGSLLDDLELPENEAVDIMCHVYVLPYILKDIYKQKERRDAIWRLVLDNDPKLEKLFMDYEKHKNEIAERIYYGFYHHFEADELLWRADVMICSKEFKSYLYCREIPDREIKNTLMRAIVSKVPYMD